MIWGTAGSCVLLALRAASFLKVDGLASCHLVWSSRYLAFRSRKADLRINLRTRIDMINPAEMLIWRLKGDVPGLCYARKIGHDLGREALRLPWLNGDGDLTGYSLRVSESKLRNPAPYRDALNHPIRVIGQRTLRQERELT